MNAKSFVVHRELLYSMKGQTERRPFIVRIGAPRPLDAGAAQFNFDAGAAACTVQLEGEVMRHVEVHGIDALHALSQALDIDPLLRGLSDKYDFYWATGEPYFDDAGPA
jgi:hypothetical protein